MNQSDLEIIYVGIGIIFIVSGVTYALYFAYVIGVGEFQKGIEFQKCVSHNMTEDDCYWAVNHRR